LKNNKDRYPAAIFKPVQAAMPAALPALEKSI